jgi:hypothetical protein
MNISTSNKKLKALIRLFYFVTIIMFGLSFSSCADSSDWQTRINEEYGYKIEYPRTWQLAKTEGKSPSTKSKNFDKFQKEGKVICPTTGLVLVDAELSIIIEENSGLSLERWLNENQIEKNRSVTTELPYKIGGQKAIKVITKFENPNKPSKKEVDKGHDNIYIMKNDKIYNFDLCNRNTVKEEFETICEAMMKSFTFIK